MRRRPTVRCVLRLLSRPVSGWVLAPPWTPPVDAAPARVMSLETLKEAVNALSAHPTPQEMEVREWLAAWERRHYEWLLRRIGGQS